MRDLPRLPGVIALAAFFIFGSVMSGLSLLALWFPGGALDPIWRLHPAAHEGFLRMGVWAIALMCAVSLGCAFAAAGLWLRAQWGYWIALGILMVNLAGDTINALLQQDMRMLIGVCVAGVLIAYLLSAKVKRQFDDGTGLDLH